MPMKPPAIGYLRRDISGVAQSWDETQIRSLAERLGYRFTKTVVFSDRTADPIGRLLDVVTTTEAAAIVTPSLTHLGSDLPHRIVAACDIITVSPRSPTREPSPPSPPRPARGPRTRWARISFGGTRRRYLPGTRRLGSRAGKWGGDLRERTPWTADYEPEHLGDHDVAAGRGGMSRGWSWECWI